MENIYQRISNEDDYGPDDTEQSEIQDFFKDQTIFLTGCTGFLGTCFVEKLLRSCSGLKKLYVLVRPNKMTPEKRIEHYFKNLFFDKLRELQPNFASKIVIIEGNLGEDGINLRDEDRKMIINEITLMIHNAANVKFDARVSTILRCNVLGSKYMLDLAKKCKQLKCFCYISTAYSHCYQRHIEEKCYPPPGDLKVIQDLIDVDEQTPNGLSELAKNDVCYPWANMYTYSKSTAEWLVEETAKEVNFPCVIYRPSIVISTYQEPIVGWSANMNGLAPLSVGTGLGLFHVGYVEKYAPVDVIPADMCTNALLAITWDVVTHRKENIGNAMVFNYGSSVVNPTSFGDLNNFIAPRATEIPSIKMLAPYFIVLTFSMLQFLILHILFHFIPALIGDLVLIATFHKPKALPMFWKVSINLPRITYFLNGAWRIHVEETQKVWDKMNKRDRHLFFCDFRLFDWPSYFYTYWAGIRLYTLKDPTSTIPAARRKYLMFQGLYEVVKGLFYIFIFYYALKSLLITTMPLRMYALQIWDTYY